MKPKVMILTGVGINSNRELAEAFELSGAEAEELHVSRLEENPNLVEQYQLLAFPGGFSYGDHLSSGKILANLLKVKLGEHFQKCREKNIPMIGICNGFQILVKLGLLPQMNGEFKQQASLIQNDSGQYEDRWVKLGIDEAARKKSPWLSEIEELACPVRHGEGKLVLESEDQLSALQASGQIAFRYTLNREPTQSYPQNPNGSWDAIAGLTDPTGLILGLMPHPEVAIHRLQQPDWTRNDSTEEYTPCLKLFKNIVDFIIKS